MGGLLSNRLKLRLELKRRVAGRPCIPRMRQKWQPSKVGMLIRRGVNQGQCQDRATCSSSQPVQGTQQQKSPSLGQHLGAEEIGILLTRMNEHPECKANPPLVKI